MKRPCLDCGTPTTATRCKPCHNKTPQAQRQRYRSSRTWTQTSRALITTWRQQHGDHCPGDGPDHPAHPSTDLTVDHIDPLATTGHDTGNYRILCRSRNSHLGATQ